MVMRNSWADGYQEYMYIWKSLQNTIISIYIWTEKNKIFCYKYFLKSHTHDFNGDYLTMKIANLAKIYVLEIWF